MARIGGIDLPRKKRVEVALQYIYGIGVTRARDIMQEVGFDKSLRTHDLTDEQVAQLRNAIESNYKIEGDLRREVGLSIKRLMDLGCYRGLRHRRGLPVRGQRTRTNARTRKGPRKAVRSSSAKAATR